MDVNSQRISPCRTQRRFGEAYFSANKRITWPYVAVVAGYDCGIPIEHKLRATPMGRMTRKHIRSNAGRGSVFEFHGAKPLLRSEIEKRVCG